MHTTKLTKLLVLSALGAGALITVAFASHFGNSRLTSSFPDVVVWAWERPENLAFIDAKKVGVAYLAKTISLEGDRLTSRPRLQALLLPEKTTITAVVRIEVHSPTLSNSQMLKTAAEISALARLPNVRMVQIDFDATRSQREFYRNLISQVREQLPVSTRLSITALGSWCLGDDWLSDLPIDEAVPMMFRMGVERQQILSQLRSGASFKSEPCRSSAGVSTDEPFNFDPSGSRLYIFNPQPWSPESLKTALENYHR